MRITHRKTEILERKYTQGRYGLIDGLLAGMNLVRDIMSARLQQQGRAGAAVLLRPACNALKFLIAMAAVLIYLDRLGVNITTVLAGLGVGGMADKPIVREWNALADGDLDDALNAFAWDLGGSDDIHATSKYRRRLVRLLGRRVIEEAKSCQS